MSQSDIQSFGPGQPNAHNRRELKGVLTSLLARTADTDAREHLKANIQTLTDMDPKPVLQKLDVTRQQLAKKWLKLFPRTY